MHVVTAPEEPRVGILVAAAAGSSVEAWQLDADRRARQ
jgi:hypothetical protein